MLCISPKGPEHLHAGSCSLRHYPRYPWEQRGSDGNYTGVIEQGCLIIRSQDTPGEGTAQPAEKEVQHRKCPTTSPSSLRHRCSKLHHNQLRYQLRRHHLLSQVVCRHLEIVHPPVHNPIFQGTLWSSYQVCSSRLRD